MAKKKQARKYPRVEKIYFTAVKRYDEEGELKEGYTGSTLNISEGGMLVETENPIPFLAQIELTLALEDDLLKLKGEVAHLKKREDGVVEMGFRFLDVGKDARKALKQAMKQ